MSNSHRHWKGKRSSKILLNGARLVPLYRKPDISKGASIDRA